jgi:hypothetical protein
MTGREKVIRMNNMSNHQAVNTMSVTSRKPSVLIDKPPCLPALIGKLALKSSTYQLSDVLPALKSQHDDLCIDPKHLASFRAVCGFNAGSDIPATYLQTLAMPLVLNIMSNSQFPLRAMGMVHLRNKVAVLENFDYRQPVSLSVSVGTSSLSSRGLEWNIDFTATVDNQQVWAGASTYLHSCETGISHREKPKLIRGDNPQDWFVPKGVGRRYGLISGDCNPIHLTDLTAKIFGFKAAIAHGMWSKTSCLAALEDQLPKSGYAVDVVFHRPLFLPSNVKFYTKNLETGQHFSLFNDRGEKAYLTGTIT